MSIGSPPNSPYFSPPDDCPTVPYAMDVYESANSPRQAAPPIWPYPPPMPRHSKAAGGSGCARVLGTCLMLVAGVLVGIAIGRSSALMLPFGNLAMDPASHAASLARTLPTPTPAPTDTPTPQPTATPIPTQPAETGAALSEDEAASLITQYYNCCGAEEGAYVIYQIDSLRLTQIDVSDIAICARYQYAATSDPNTPQGTDMRAFNLSAPDGAAWQVSGMGGMDSCSMQDG